MGDPGAARLATVGDRSKIAKGPGSRATAIAMAYKLIEASQSRWRAVNAPHLVAGTCRRNIREWPNSSNALTKRPQRSSIKDLDPQGGQLLDPFSGSTT